MVKSEVTGVRIEDLDAMFNVTEEKKKNMAAFKGKRTLKLPEVGNKTGITIKPKWSTDEKGNPAPILRVKSDSPKMRSADGTMPIMTVEELDAPGEECSIPYPKSLHYSFTGFIESRGLKYEDIFGKWFRVTAEEYPNSLADSGVAKAYRASFREDLNKVIKGNGSASKPVGSQFD